MISELEKSSDTLVGAVERYRSENMVLNQRVQEQNDIISALKVRLLLQKSEIAELSAKKSSVSINDVKSAETLTPVRTVSNLSSLKKGFQHSGAALKSQLSLQKSAKDGEQSNKQSSVLTLSRTELMKLLSKVSDSSTHGFNDTSMIERESSPKTHDKEVLLQTVTYLNSALESNQKEVKSAKSEVTALLEKIKLIESQHETNETQLLSEIKCLREELKKKNSHLKEMSDLLEVQQSFYQNDFEKNMEKTDAVLTLKEALHTLQEEKVKLESCLIGETELRKTLQDDHSAECIAHAATLKELSRMNISLNESLTRIEHQKKEFKEIRDSMKTEICSMSERIEQLKDQLQQSLGRNSTLERECSALRQECDVRTHLIKELSARNQKWEETQRENRYWRELVEALNLRKQCSTHESNTSL